MLAPSSVRTVIRARVVTDGKTHRSNGACIASGALAAETRFCLRATLRATIGIISDAIGERCGRPPGDFAVRMLAGHRDGGAVLARDGVAAGAGLGGRVPHRVGYWHEPGSMVSAMGKCRPFDVRCDGTVFGSGVGIVVLKPLQAAVDAGDRIHAVIRGSAINNDGSMKMGYAAPNPAASSASLALPSRPSTTARFIRTRGSLPAWS